ncbi:uncharacterized protein LOC112593973 [Melanaphis sacchari]|uniref:uncharacterized protein LOC112593973 n=1 Tax=Melanaphis sacchari TaxID=742174 RepID=UPI000DC149FC|nr:uncharacterized protein LOC112593973 [Melanaphis sacchari]
MLVICTSSSWANGMNDWKHISEKIKLHENHINACLTVDRWEKNNTLSEEIKSQISVEVGFWRQVIKRIINVTMTLGFQNLSFRGHNEKIDSENRGNFLRFPFFSYITDTTQDIRKQDQISQIIRYVVIEKNEDNKPIKLRIEESFLGFCLLNDHSASGFAD